MNMQPHVKTGVLHVVLTILGALTGIAGAQQWTPAAVPCPVCPVCPDPDVAEVVVPTPVPVPVDPAATVTP